MNIQLIHCPTPQKLYNDMKIIRPFRANGKIKLQYEPQILFNKMKDRTEQIAMHVDIKTPSGVRRNLYVEGTLSIYQGGDDGETLREVEIEMVSLPRKIEGGHIYTEITDLLSVYVIENIESAVIEKHI